MGYDFRLAVTAHHHGVGWHREGGAFVFEVQTQAALRGGDFQAVVAVGEVAVVEPDGGSGEEGDIVVGEGVDNKGVYGVGGAVVV